MLPQKPIEDPSAPMSHMPRDGTDDEAESGWKHWGLMVLCCLPMIAIAVLLIAGIWR
jgi:hypothetical protein